jgi:choline dehydrogenase-like flavoprotein
MAFLRPRERRTVEAFAEVFIAGAGEVLTPAQVAQNVEAHVSAMRTKRIRSLHVLLWAIEYLLPLTVARWRFTRLSPAARRRLIERRITGPRAVLRNLAKLKVLFLAGYYDDPLAQADIGVRRTRAVESLELPPLEVRPPADGEHTIVADYCVIGSGAGGAVIAAHAARAGRRVVLLEEGPQVRGAQMTGRENAMSALLYKESGLQATVDLGMSVLQGRVLGGTTLINNCICLRLDDPDIVRGDTLAHWHRLGATVDPAGLARSYDAVEAAISVARIPATLDHGNGQALLDGWSELTRRGLGDPALPAYWFRKNYNGCGGAGVCNWGCPHDRKASALETYVTAAVEHGARVITECHAERILVEDGRATAVRVRHGGRELRVKAGAVVVACGAIGSSVLLLKSGIRHNVGTRLSFNAATVMLARFAKRLDAYDGDQMTAYVDGGSYLLESSFQPPVAHAISVPGWFEQHFDRMREYPHYASCGVVIGTDHNGRVKQVPILRDLLGPIDYRMTERDLDALKRGMTTATQVYLAAGADFVLPSTFADAPLPAGEFSADDPERIRAHLDRAIRSPRDVTLNSSHPQGGNPMGDRRIGAVDAGFRVHGHRNLFVCDASVFPTTIRINPMLTIMAMADYAWREHIGA